MSDEQTIYIDPEDDVTTVRERLRQTPSKRITLVIPPQSQLRSHLTWRLLNTRARELGKELLIVSSDPQIRSLAHAVKFKVAHSLEASSQSGKSRPTSRPGRATPGKSRTSGRPTAARDVPSTRRSRSLRGTSGTSERGGTLPHAEPTPLPSKPDSSWYAGSTPSHRSLETPQIEDLGSDETLTGHSLPSSYASTPSPLFGPTETIDRSHGSSHRPSRPFRPGTTPPIYPLAPEHIDEPDPLLDDYEQARDIRKAATEGRKRLEQISHPSTGPEHTTSHPHMPDDPFMAMEDSQPPPPLEQHAGAFLDDFDSNEPQPYETHQIEDVSDQILDSAIEFRGDQDDFVPPPSPTPITTRSEQETHDKIQPDVPVSRNAGTRSRRSKPLSATPPARPDFEDDALPAIIDERPTRIIQPDVPRRSKPLQPPAPTPRNSGKLNPPRAPKRPSGPVARPDQQAQAAKTAKGARSASQPLIAGGSRASQRPPTQPSLTRPSTRGRTGTTPLSTGIPRPTQARRPGTAPSRTSTSIGSRKAPPKRRNNRRSYIWIGLIAIIIIAVALGFYYGPSTNVTLTVKTQDYSHAIEAKAIMPERGKAQPALPAQQFTQTFTQSGQGKATGEKNVGTKAATGLVLFTNQGDKDLVIPSGIKLVTNTNPQVEFITDAEGFVAHGDSIPVSVKASQPGEGGNVDENTIVTIPDESLKQIADWQTPKITPDEVKLTVTNGSATAGGGAQPKPIVQESDLTKTRDDLSKQLNGQIDNWVKKLSQDGYLSKPQLSSTLLNPPAAGQVEDDGTFPAKVQVKAVVLLVRTSDLQKEAARQLNSFLKKEKDQKLKSLHILDSTQTPVKLDDIKQKDGNTTSLNLTFTATGQAGPDLAITQIQDLVNGKSLTDARVSLENLRDRGVTGVDIQTVPGFIPRVTSLNDHIHVVIEPEKKTNNPPKQ